MCGDLFDNVKRSMINERVSHLKCDKLKYDNTAVGQ